MELSGVDKKHLKRSKTYSYDRIKDLSEDVLRLKKISRWRLIWRKMVMTNQMKKNKNFDHRVRYDRFTYSQNFENDGTIAYHDDPDVSSKSFSTRFVGSSKVFNLNYT
ncbi:hypothetical protein V5N11_022960 [Cardamine amara subsp. amara]|uniref:Uncharacterized protein n=1 Tax=Cardamine amara subsp. amara TaxID=228776 RepID=A0ABD0ZXS6_CARAN